MDAESWVEVKAILAEALDLEPAARAALLEARCAGREPLRREVEALIEAHDRAADFMHTPAAASAGWNLDTPRRSLVGRRIGPFRLTGQIGSGGMGIVYDAERADGEYEQHVAIKIVDLPQDDAEALARFKVERQILATLRHPGIVAFIDGGLTEDGQAFLVMERVDGVRLTEFCRTERLGLDDRLRLVERVCAAVQYAHQHGVVHRDLKPGNILVTADGAPKVLDFGVAKLIAGSGESDATATGMLRPMTPDYASPEQLRGLPVTTATDIYALGVLLYEIVAGARPYDTSGKTLDRILQIVVTDEPTRPSQMLTHAADRVPYDAAAVRGDLDAIVRKAMHKEPAGRYASAQELADDLARHRAAEPVLAREPSLGYLLRRGIRRHRAAAAATIVAVVAVLAALGISIWQMRRAAAARDRAEARFNDTRQIASALIFKVHDGIAPLAGSTPVRRMIVAEALTYLERLSRDPAVDDTLRRELATAYQRIGDVQGNPSGPNLGDRAGARTSYQRAIELLEPLASKPGAARSAAVFLTSTQMQLASVDRALGNNASALEIVTSAVARAQALVDSAPSDDQARSLLAGAYFSMASLSDPKEAVPHWNKAGELYGSLLAEKPDDPERQRNVALVEKYLGANYQLKRDFDQAAVHYQRARELDERRLAAAPANRTVIFDVAIDLSNIAAIDQLAGRLSEAASGFERSLKMREQLAALDPQDVQIASRVAFAHGRLTSLYDQMKRVPEALAHARKGVATMEAIARVDADEKGTLASHLMTLGQVENRSGDHAAACRAFRRSSAVAAEVSRSDPLAPDVAAQIERLQKLLAPELAKCGG